MRDREMHQLAENTIGLLDFEPQTFDVIQAVRLGTSKVAVDPAKREIRRMVFDDPIIFLFQPIIRHCFLLPFGSRGFKGNTRSMLRYFPSWLRLVTTLHGR